MFELTGRQFKALQEIAKAAKKSKYKPLAETVFIYDDKMYVTDSHTVVCIEDPRLGEMPNYAYTGVLTAKVKVTDRIQFDAENDCIMIGDKTGRVWNEFVCTPDDVYKYNKNSYYNAINDMYVQIAAQPVFNADVTKYAISPVYLSIVGKLFQDFGVHSAMTLLRSMGTTTGGCAPIPMFAFNSYREVSSGKQPGFSLHAIVMGINEHFEE